MPHSRVVAPDGTSLESAVAAFGARKGKLSGCGASCSPVWMHHPPSAMASSTWLEFMQRLAALVSLWRQPVPEQLATRPRERLLRGDHFVDIYFRFGSGSDFAGHQKRFKIRTSTHFLLRHITFLACTGEQNIAMLTLGFGCSQRRTR